MPKLLYTWYFEKFTGSVTSSGHSALRHEVSKMFTFLLLILVSLFFVLAELLFMTGFVALKSDSVRDSRF